MDSSVAARPNFYEILGLAPGSTAAEIAQAFASRMGLFAAQPVAAVAELSIAYETLRDPARRRAYDASLRPPPPPQPRYTAQWNSAPFIASALAAAAAAAEPGPARPRPEPETSAEEDPAPFTVSPSRQSAVDTAAWHPESNAAADSPLTFVRRIESHPMRGPHDGPARWSRTAIAIGGVVIAVAGLGAVAGWSAGLVDQPQQPAPHVTTVLPPAKPSATPAVASSEPDWAVSGDRVERPRRAAASSRQVGRLSRRPALAAIAPQTDSIDGGSAIPTVSAAEAVPASLPLSNPVIARTIGRIGYSCGSVASASPIEGAPGAFKVTCTSGHSYKAAPVRGRYHFRRWSGR